VRKSQFYKIDSSFDIVVILRWWGSDTELVEFNNFNLSKAICEYNLPILSAIGHSTNQSIVELVSNRYFITPTDLANFIVENFRQIDLTLLNIKNDLNNKVKDLINSVNIKENKLESFKSTIYHITNQFSKSNNEKLNNLKNNLIYNKNFYLTKKINKLDKIVLELESVDIIKLFDRWFSIVYKDWKILKSKKYIEKWDILEIQFKNTRFKVKVV